jgi:hypothetical protein
MSGQEFITLQPASGAPVYIRFVENDPSLPYSSLTSWGWNATEVLVDDPDALAERLADSAFQIIGPPKDLWVAPDAPRAMQALGPGNEVLYLTQNSQVEGAFGLSGTNYGVERVFIMVVGGPSMEALRSFYADTLGAASEAATPWQIEVISKANGLDPTTTYPLTVAPLAPGYLVELDEYPDSIGARTRSDGYLPPGVAVVGFSSGTLAEVDLMWRSSPRPMAEFPYDGRSVGVIVGPASEWIELIETADGKD